MDSDRTLNDGKKYHHHGHQNFNYSKEKERMKLTRKNKQSKLQEQTNDRLSPKQKKFIKEMKLINPIFNQV